jgi:hypothetical protein
MRLVVCFALLAGSLTAQTAAQNVILVTADGLRWQELFRGLDPVLAKEKTAHMSEADPRYERYHRASEVESRQALLPFFWKQFAPRGVVLPNVHITNHFRVSYPGYSEILTGRTQDEVIKGNDPIRNPTQTVLEFLRLKLGVSKEQVAVFASWDHFRYIAESAEGQIVINAGYQTLEGRNVPPRIAELNRYQFHVLTPWDEARHDFFTGELALEYMKSVKPRVMFVSFDETDDWAHDHRYDRVLDSIAEFDKFLERLWNQIESMKEYRGRTAVVITSDHGRGSTIDDWHGHGAKTVGADRIWLAIAGPGTPAKGEVRDAAEQRDIAPTILKLMGIDPKEYKGATGKPVGAAVR